MITAHQIKAARALLDWKQSDLANAANISLPSINNIERGIGSPRTDTLLAIQQAMEKVGIEFLTGGVRLKDEIFEIHKFEGADFIEKQNDDLFDCMRGHDDIARMCGLNERLFAKFAPDQILRYDHHQKQTLFQERILVKNNDRFFLANPDAYRWISPELIGTIPYLVYQDRFVMIMWESQRVVIIRNQSIADTFRKQFDFLWNMAKPVPMGSRSQIEDKNFIADISNKPKKPKK